MMEESEAEDGQTENRSPRPKEEAGGSQTDSDSSTPIPDLQHVSIVSQALCFSSKKEGPDTDRLRIDPIIALIDMDCFYVQVELRLQPEFRGKPSAVVQYKTQFKGGGMIAVSYEARARGVKRNFRGDEGREKCPELHLFTVPELHGKADLSRYREAGAEVIQVMKRSFERVERASIDEAYVELTAEVKALLPRYLSGELSLGGEELGPTCVPGWETAAGWLDHTNIQREIVASAADSQLHMNNLALAIAAKLINILRENIFRETEFHCSAGISFSKTLAKLACGINKPRKQTILPTNTVANVFDKTEIKSIRGLGGKLGDQIVGQLKISKMGELSRISKASLLRYFDPKTADWLQSLAAGKDSEAVQPRELPKSIGCSKNFMGIAALKTRDQVRQWLTQFAQELEERLTKDQTDNNRTASLLTVFMTWIEDGERKTISRCAPLTSYQASHMAADGFSVADKCLTSLGFEDGRYSHHLISLGITASKMKEGQTIQRNRIESYFQSPKKDNEATSSSVDKTDQKIDLDTQPSEEPGICDSKPIASGSDDFCEIISVKERPRGIATRWPTLSVPLPSTSRRRSLSITHETHLPEEITKENIAEPGRSFEIFNCSKCRARIWSPKMKVEHEDYHMALELSRTLSTEGSSPKISSDDKPVVRKKLKLNDPVVKSKKPSLTNTLDGYFKKKAN